jgi:hypothetical protein
MDALHRRQQLARISDIPNGAKLFAANALWRKKFETTGFFPWSRLGRIGAAEAVINAPVRKA